GDVGIEACRDTRRFTAKRDGGDRNAELQADQVPFLVGTHVATGRIGHDVVLLETILDVLTVAFKANPDAFPYIVGDLDAVGREAGHDLDLPLGFQHAAFGARTHQRGNVVH